MGWLYPYNHDDWYWGTMEYVFPSPENGRYAGHLFPLLLTRSRVLRMVVIAITITGIIYCIERIFKKSSAFIIAKYPGTSGAYFETGSCLDIWFFELCHIGIFSACICSICGGTFFRAYLSEDDTVASACSWHDQLSID